VVDEAVRTRYRLSDDPVQIDTCLKTRADAQAEAARRLSLNRCRAPFMNLTESRK
jgi:hypothetical protein